MITIILEFDAGAPALKVHNGPEFESNEHALEYVKERIEQNRVCQMAYNVCVYRDDKLIYVAHALIAAVYSTPVLTA